MPAVIKRVLGQRQRKHADSWLAASRGSEERGARTGSCYPYGKGVPADRVAPRRFDPSARGCSRRCGGPTQTAICGFRKFLMRLRRTCKWWKRYAAPVPVKVAVVRMVPRARGNYDLGVIEAFQLVASGNWRRGDSPHAASASTDSPRRSVAASAAWPAPSDRRTRWLRCECRCAPRTSSKWLGAGWPASGSRWTSTRRGCAMPEASPSASAATPSVRCTHGEPTDATTVRGLPRRPSPRLGKRFADDCGTGTRCGGKSSARPKPHRAGIGGLLQLRLSGERAARGAASSVPHGPLFSPPPV